MLTDREVKAAAARPTVYELDADGHGLKLRVTPGGAKGWSLRYRNTGGERRRITIGSYPDMSLSKARTDAAKLRDRIRSGFDPQAARIEQREAMRMADLFGTGDDEPGWYLGTYVHAAGRLGTSKTAHSIRTDTSYVTKHLRPRKRLMAKRVEAVTVMDLERIKAAVPPGTWRKLRDILRVCFRHAEQAGVIPVGSNPAAKVKASPGGKVERYLSPDERRELGKALKRAEGLGPTLVDAPRGTTGGLSPGYVRLFRLLSLTGCRLGEILRLRWEHIDWHRKVLRLPSSKTGRRDVPLTSQAVAFLKAEQRDVGLVCSTADGKALQEGNVQRAWRSVRSQAELDDVRLHDLRHSWASDAVSAGVPLAVIGAVLGHRSTQTTARYAHLHDRAIREGLEATGAAIEAATRKPRRR